MTDYNVFRNDLGKWAADLAPTNLGHQDRDNPIPLTYSQARQVMEHLRKLNLDVEVRELPDTKKEAVGYNVWCNSDGGRWTRYDVLGDGITQEPDKPVPLTFARASAILPAIDSNLVPEIKEIGIDGHPQDVLEGSLTAASATPAAPAASSDPPTGTQIVSKAIDFDAYNGFTGGRIYGMRQLHQNVEPEIDPYTGLRKEK
jgi:hypothetical protein